MKKLFFSFLCSLHVLVPAVCLHASDVLLKSEPIVAISKTEETDARLESEQTDAVPEERNNNNFTTKVNGVAVYAMNSLDNAQANLSTNFLGAVARLDRIFGDERLLDDTDTSRMILGIGVQVSRFDGLSLHHKTRAQLSLPRMKNRLMLVFSQETEADDVETSSQIRSAYKDTTPDLGLRLNLLNPEITHLTASSGLRLGSTLQGYGRIRASRMFLLDALTSFYAAQTLQCYTEDRWSETSTLRFSHCIFENWVLESLLSLTWREQESGYEPYLMFSLMNQYKDKRGTRFDVGASWPETPHTRESRYFVQSTLRHRLGREWLFGEVRVGVGFPEEENFAADPFVRVMVEMVLEK